MKLNKYAKIIIICLAAILVTSFFCCFESITAIFMPFFITIFVICGAVAVITALVWLFDACELEL